MKKLFACSALISTLVFGQNIETKKGYQIISDECHLSILNPSLSERKSIKLRLDNGVEAYLISDPDCDQSAAALSVEAGSWQDPKQYPGMAHFCEHMLFMGTGAYPKEFEYMHFITDHGGNVNASTWPDHTVYMFSINNEAFSGALDRFSHFFIDPLFSTSAINRELHAVDQEHAKNIENDDWRLYMILKETGNPNHPNSGFSTGNAKTLSGIPQSALKSWYQEYYTPSKMHLFAISNLSIDEMVTLVIQDFSRVPQQGKPAAAITEMMLSQKQMGKMLYIKPVRDLRSISLVWEVPQEFTMDNERGLENVAYALKAEGDNSLSGVLKKEKIAERVDIELDRMSKDQAYFRIDINLTPYGVSHIDTAINRCFQAIANLKEKGIPHYLFEERQRLALYNYEYQSREEAFEYASRIGNELLYENIDTYPLKTVQPTVYDPEFYSDFIQTLTPQKCLFVIVADPALTGVEPTAKEKWMQAQYTFKDIPQDKLVAWSRVHPSEQIALPGPNPFVPNSLSLTKGAKITTPQIIEDDDSGKVYFASDTSYLVPETSAIFSIKSPVLDGSAKKAALSALYLKALREKLIATLFFANQAGVQPSFSQDNIKLNIAVQGFSEKTPLLIKDIFSHLKQVQPTQEQFEIYKQALLSAYDNANKELPVFQASEQLKSLLFNDVPTSQERYKALKTITYEDFAHFSQELFKKAYVEGFFYGNLSQNDAQTILSDIKTHLAAQPYPKNQHYKRQYLNLPDKDGPYLISQQTERQGNGVILVLEEGSFTFEKRAAQQVIAKALKELFFDTLRTKQQTAYFARAWDSEEEKQLLQYFAVQSSTHNARDLLARFELFIEDFLKNLPDRISEEHFKELCKMLIVTLEMPPENLQSMGARLFSLAFQYDGDFNWYEKRVESLKILTYDQMKQAAEEFLSRDNSKRIAILVEGVLQPENDFRYNQVSKDDLRSIGTYSQVR